MRVIPSQSCWVWVWIYVYIFPHSWSHFLHVTYKKQCNLCIAFLFFSPDVNCLLAVKLHSEMQCRSCGLLLTLIMFTLHSHLILKKQSPAECFHCRAQATQEWCTDGFAFQCGTFALQCGRKSLMKSNAVCVCVYCILLFFTDCFSNWHRNLLHTHSLLVNLHTEGRSTTHILKCSSTSHLQ